MNWKLKSTIQRACAKLPAGSERIYYFLQRKFGAMRRPPDPLLNFLDLSRILSELRTAGFDLHDKRVMEVGTGRRLDMAIAFFLCGPGSVVTYDLHRYLKEELVLGSIRAMIADRVKIAEWFASLTSLGDLEGRIRSLEQASTLEQVCAAAGIEYHAPADAASNGLPDGSIDLQFSYTVLEHILEPVLKAILKEARRILKPDGLACHHIDLSDYFAPDDSSISRVNFLQFEEKDWQKYNDNQFAYQKRMRVPEYEQLYSRAGHDVRKGTRFLNQTGKDAIEAGLPLTAKFRGVPSDVLTTVVVRVTSKPAG